MLRHAQPLAGMPARLVQHQHNLLAWPCADRVRKGGELCLKEGDRDTCGQMPDGAARGGMDEADQIAPAVAVLDDRYRPLANRRSHPPDQRLEPNAMLIHRPQFHLGLWVSSGYRLDKRADLFLKASCSSEAAAT